MTFDHWEARAPKFGDHIRVGRGIYAHHGIYVSDNEVINFTEKSGKDFGLHEQMKEARIMVSTLKEFLAGGQLEVNISPAKNPPEKVVELARSCIGTRYHKYNLALNNCEHFCNECRNNSHISKQVQKVVGTIVALGAGIAAIAINKNNSNHHKSRALLAEDDDQKNKKS